MRGRAAGLALGVRSWPVWENPSWLVALIAAVVAAYVAATGVAAWVAPFRLAHLALFAALLACVAVTVELTRRAGENTGLISDVYAVWELPVAILLPPVYALVAPAVRIVLTQWRVRRLPVHRRVFTAAAIGLSYGGASLAFHAFTRSGLASFTGPGAHALVWILAVAAAGALQWATNLLLVLPAIRGSDPTARLRDLVLARERVVNDVAELCVALLVTLAISVSPVTIIFALPLVTVLQRSVRHAQLVNASRVDSKTGLLNAGTWEREAAAEVARAVRTRTPLAAVLIDVDHFKSVNDTHGHLVGDKALRAISRTLTIFLRDYDLAGRFGGEEFALVLPQTSAQDAHRIADRIRAHIADTPAAIADGPAPEPVWVTVSVGVAALGETWDARGGNQFTDLLATADMALYQAKASGRNRVWMITDTREVAARGEADSLPSS